jgi:uncharacterized cupredoxin-like copper-binding protein
MMKRWIALAIVLVPLVALSSAGVPATAADGDETEITLVMGKPSEFAFSPSEVMLKNGQETVLIIKNEGQVEHELMSVLFGSAWLRVFVEAGEGVWVEARPLEIELEPGQQTTLKLLPQVPDHVLEEKGGKAEFEFGCFIKDHYKAGMKGTFIVEGQGH